VNNVHGAPRDQNKYGPNSNIENDKYEPEKWQAHLAHKSLTGKPTEEELQEGVEYKSERLPANKTISGALQALNDAFLSTSFGKVLGGALQMTLEEANYGLGDGPKVDHSDNPAVLAWNGLKEWFKGLGEGPKTSPNLSDAEGLKNLKWWNPKDDTYGPKANKDYYLDRDDSGWGRFKRSAFGLPTEEELAEGVAYESERL